MSALGRGIVAGFAAGAVLASGAASAGQLLTNGGFETGSFSGWNAISDGGTSGCLSNVWLANTTGAQGCTSYGAPTPAPASGHFAAYNTFDGQAGSYQLAQSFLAPSTIVSATLSFADTYTMSNYTWALRTLEVQIYDGTNTKLLQTIYSATIGPNAKQGWNTVTADMTSALRADAGQRVTLRLSELVPGNYTGAAGFGLDDVSVIVADNVPEPATGYVFGMALLGLTVLRRRHA